MSYSNDEFIPDRPDAPLTLGESIQTILDYLADEKKDYQSSKPDEQVSHIYTQIKVLEENKNLMAASNELLSALENIVEPFNMTRLIIQNREERDRVYSLVKRAKLAIARATNLEESA